MGGGLESCCVGRVCGADGAVRGRCKGKQPSALHYIWFTDWAFLNLMTSE